LKKEFEMQTTGKENKPHNDHVHHGDCCGHDHDHSHDHKHDHSHDHHDHHGHEHHHDHHDCCGHDHAHGHQHLSKEECSSLVAQAQESNDPEEILDLLLIAGEGFAHLGDAVGTAAVNGILAKKLPALPPLSKLKTAQMNALKALELALNKDNEKAKAALTESVTQLEDFTGENREEVEPLLADVRKALAGIRTSGLRSLLNKFKF
jgi:hypothetical protein